MTQRKKRILTVTLLLVVAAVIFVFYYFLSIYKGLEGLNKTPANSSFIKVSTDNAEALEAPEWEGTEPVNILLMGVDARGSDKGEVPRSDSMLVVSLNPANKHIHVFSILRDTYTDIPGYGKNRINTAVTHGPDTAMKAVSELLGVPVHFYVYTDFQGFIKLVDAVGGLDFYVEKDMYYESKADQHEYDINLKQGQQHFDGKTALQYVRFRHDAMSDYSRTKRQRQLITALAEKVKTTTSIMKFPSILEEISPYIDTNLSVSDMWNLASVGYQSTLQGNEQIPPMKLLKETYVGRAAVLDVKSRTDLKQFVQSIINSDASNSITDNPSEQK
ncbi:MULTISPECIES: LCP family protein [Paenibacillus]|uniref:LCP family protein n=1 Tax=Paenibacillus TaxID=44249 RepID=UPI0004193F78|nr:MULTISPECIES: LCP family protein [Paenibacillus]AHC22576.2 transcriptional regulator [Paenibacillus polymyxa CR1]ALA40553.1 transcriptional regulator [Paenibacillus peoriae]APQ57824.1 transcriptional regulator [Paenibacillus polymyxa]MCP3746540.1 LCP family protein [Paenibacillus sp. A3M_27_13]ODB64125.1 transcriptional regulator [Paenibacillus polymyxa]